MEETKYYIPTIKDLYIGLECEVIDEMACGNEIGLKYDRKCLYGIDYDPKIIYKSHIVNERDIKFYTSNPHQISNDIRIKIDD